MSDVTHHHVTGDWRHLIEDGIVDHDPYPDQVLPTGHVKFEPVAPRVAVAGAPAIAYTLGSDTALISDGLLTDMQGRPGIWLVGEIGGHTVRWRATVNLEYRDQKIFYPTVDFDLTEDVRLTGLIQQTGKHTPFVIDPRIEDLAGRLADVDQVVGQAEQIVADAAQSVTDAQEQADRARDEADRAIGLAGAQDEHIAGTLEDPDSATHAAFKAVGNATYADKGVEVSVDGLETRKAERSELPAYLADAIAQDETVSAAAAAAVDSALVGRRVAPPFTDRGEWSQQAYPVGSVVDHEAGRWAAQPFAVAISRTNYAINPRFASNRTRWSLPSGVTGTPNDDATMTITLDEDVTSDTSVLTPTTSGRAPTDVGDVLSAGIVVSVPTGGSAVTVKMRVLSYPSTSTWSENVVVAPGESKRLTVNGVTVTSGTEAALLLSVVAPAPSGAEVTVSEPILEKTAEVGDYFDGDTPDVEGDLSITYEWAGEPTDSVSTMVGEGSASLVTGEPGVDQAWVRLGAQQSATPPAVRPLVPPASYPDPEPVNTYVMDMKPDGITLLSITGWHIRVSTDEGVTWTVLSDVRDHGLNVPGTGRWLPDGEVIMTVRGDEGMPTTVHRSVGASSGGPITAWEHVHTYESVYGGAAHGWSWSIYNNIVLIAAYGSKTGEDNARHVYMSLDMGRTFTTIFELPNDPGIHMHGVAWDPYWDRIWVTWGDDLDGWDYSDDLGQTWHTAKYGDYPGADMQAVGIYPLKDCILFASDGRPNGLWRIPRSQGKHQGMYEPEVAFQFNDHPNITHLCHAIYQRTPGHPVVLGWGAEVNPGSSRILATRDGYDVCDVWTDPYTSEAGRGIRALVGPTARGNLIWEKQDSESSASPGGRLRWTTPWPGGY